MRKPGISIPSKFRFQWQGRWFRAALVPDEVGCWLRLDADLGPVPYSIEDPERRRTVLGMRGPSRIGSFGIDSAGHLHHYAEIELETMPDGPALVAALVELLLIAQPAYDRAAGWSRAA